jgi:hypothetical protein
VAEIRPLARSATAPGFVLGRKLDSIPFSAYHILIISVLALVGFIEGYDLVMTGSLLVLAKEPLNLTGPDIRSPSARPSCCASAVTCPRRYPITGVARP